MDEPPITVYMQRGQPPVVDRLDSRGEWRGEAAWPVPGASHRTLHLAADGRLVDAAAAAEGVDAIPYRATVGARAGGLWSGGLVFGLAGDQRADDAWSLVYRSEPLAEELAILGNARARSRPRRRRGVGARGAPSDVAPDGSSLLVAKGILNVTRRHSTTDPTPWTPGEAEEVTVEIDATGWIFEPGHRIALSVAGADYPNLWPTPQPATIEVLRGGPAAGLGSCCQSSRPAGSAEPRGRCNRRPPRSVPFRPRRSHRPGSIASTC